MTVHPATGVRAILAHAMRGMALASIVSVGTGCAARAAESLDTVGREARIELIKRAQVWAPTRVAAMDMRTGPKDAGAFAPNALVECTYVDKEMGGSTPKFACALPNGDELKVKYGKDNGEVYAEVAATRLLWALGFGADHMYPVRVRCHGCPAENDDGPGESAGPQPGVTMFEYAAIERKMPGRSLEGPEGEGWSWPELDQTDPNLGGASIAQRDALKLLAAFIQHTDSKREQQRLVCTDAEERPGAACRHPFMLISDVGKTFGRANAFNRDSPGSVNLDAWAEVPVWADAPGCHANLERSMTGTLENPAITDAGRRFLLERLRQLTDRQLRDLFIVARFPARTDANVGDRARAEIEAWVAAFRDKVRQIANRSCLPARGER